MPKFRKKPIVIEAHQWFRNGDHPEDHEPQGTSQGRLHDHEYQDYLQTEGKLVRRYRNPAKHDYDPCAHCGMRMGDHGWIDTLEAGHDVCPGDWIIRGVAGEFYPCKPAIFYETHDPA